MRVTTLHEVEEALRQIEPETLHEMAYQLAASHLRICDVTSKIGGCAHTDDATIRDRVDGLDRDELVGFISPVVWATAYLQPLLPV